MNEVRKKVAAMIWMAVDPRTGEPEAVAALLGIRRLNVSLDELKLALGNAAAQVRVVEVVPEFVNPVMPFGKFKGRCLTEIAKEKPAYLHWILDNVGLTGFLETQIKLVLQART